MVFQSTSPEVDIRKYMETPIVYPIVLQTNPYMLDLYSKIEFNKTPKIHLI